MRKTIDKELLSYMLLLEDGQQQKVLDYIKSLFEDEGKPTDEEELSASLDRAIQQVKEGKVKPHSEVRKRYEKWL